MITLPTPHTVEGHRNRLYQNCKSWKINLTILARYVLQKSFQAVGNSVNKVLFGLDLNGVF
jgi:hypothetical protein